jgi:hypothetical protein
MTVRKHSRATSLQFDPSASACAAYCAAAAPAPAQVPEEQLALADGDAAQYGDSPVEYDGQPFDGAVDERWFAPSEDEDADAASDEADYGA